MTSDQGKERHACRDVIRHLEDAYVARFPAEANPAPGDAPAPVDASGTGAEPSSAGVSDALAAELKAIKETTGKKGKKARDDDSERFKMLNLDMKACAFIRMRREEAAKCSPSDLVRDILLKTKAGGPDAPRSKHTNRIVPCEDVSFAGVEDIVKAAKPLVKNYFGGVVGEAPSSGEAPKPVTFAVTFAARANNTVRRDEVIKAGAALVPPPHTVDLTNPDLTIACEVMKGTASIGVAREYYALRKNNMRQCAMTDEERAAECAKYSAKPQEKNAEPSASDRVKEAVKEALKGTAAKEDEKEDEKEAGGKGE